MKQELIKSDPELYSLLDVTGEPVSEFHTDDYQIKHKG